MRLKKKKVVKAEQQINIQVKYKRDIKKQLRLRQLHKSYYVKKFFKNHPQSGPNLCEDGMCQNALVH